eukprot:CAMPEP_0184486480 /NCGR_PEP_ID=MMETSP0113_2-20130426/7966_1 /TAXON_ID=91329 /ORGANISM="Norrisiella sphaerica, Strain BC52" /LENGTH=600 /DNA_ID=CAMNT_0026868377 /DNA_START=118 /DNA_END=1920 /DNA_ORIENTATION=+
MNFSKKTVFALLFLLSFGLAKVVGYTTNIYHLKPEVGGRVIDLFNGEHFDDILQDTPNGLRPASVVFFYRSKDERCRVAFEEMEVTTAAEKLLPPRERLMIAKYDIDMHDQRLLTEFSPEQDLPKRIGLDDHSACPTVVYVPQSCDGHTDWCTETVSTGVEKVGCNSFVDHCKSKYRVWNDEGDWQTWLNLQIASEPYPPLDVYFDNYKAQAEWITRRETVTTNTYIRNNYLAPSLPKYSETGTKMIKIPEPLYKELLDFYNKYLPSRSVESWDIHGATQMNFHEVGSDLVYLDLDAAKRDFLANHYIKPLLEEWSGIKLKLSSFYGLREYFPGAWLRNHIDREDTHIISATLSVLKPNATKPWPIETIDWSGKRFRYEHKAGEMLLYESSTRPHGRPYALPDGLHVGCFVHFAPANRHEMEKFRSQLRVAREYQRKNVSTVFSYKSTPSRNSVNSKVDILNTPENQVHKLKDDRPRAKNPKTVPKAVRKYAADETDGSIGVKFINDIDVDLNLYWIDHQNIPQLNAYLVAGKEVSIRTYEQHKFFFAPVSDQNPMPEDYSSATMRGNGVKDVLASNYVQSSKLGTSMRGTESPSTVDEL